MNRSDATNELAVRPLMGVDEVARALGISRHTVYSWVAQRRIPFLKVGRLLRFDGRLIYAWLAEGVDAPNVVEDEPRAANHEQDAQR